MKKKYLVPFIAAALSLTLLSGCGDGIEVETKTPEEVAKDLGTDIEETAEETENSEEITEDTGNNENAVVDDYKTYTDNMGWEVTYNAAYFEVDEMPGDNIVRFNYIGETSGVDTIEVSYQPDLMPEDVLYQKTSGFDDGEIMRSEGFYGADNYWAFSRIINHSVEEDSNDPTTYISYVAMEHNEGTILIEIAMQEESDESVYMTKADRLSELAGSLVLLDHEPETLFAYVPGTYVCEKEEEIDGQMTEYTYTLTLKEDHTLIADFQDTVGGTWTSYEIMLDDGMTYEYTIEGDELMLDFGVLWETFERQ